MLRGDHIVPSFEEIWPSRGPTKRVKRGIEYYLDVCSTQYICDRQMLMYDIG